MYRMVIYGKNGSEYCDMEGNNKDTLELKAKRIIEGVDDHGLFYKVERKYTS